MTRTLITAVFAIATAFSTVAVQAAPQAANLSTDVAADSRQVPVKNFDVYVDRLSGFVFVKLPSGWKFVQKIDAAAMAQLPESVLTALLVPEDSGADMQMAQASARVASR